ncbi:hypothetical protein RND81_04G022000 [Saponaria officinalis]|uniref:Rubredoxin-like domain-containing protein n=1 Tax=Saponaria officinalis TaxID=3572 RepID=A0AAW1LI43_SAPOF
MASTITRPTPFIFQLNSPSHRKPELKPKMQTISAKTHKKNTLKTPTNTPKFMLRSIDVSKEDKPISEDPNSEVPTSSSDEITEEMFDKKRLEEKFAVLNTGIYECRSCGYKYDEAAGDPSYPVPPGLPFGKLPDDWRCPTCGAAKSFFDSKSVEIAGFAQNQQFGLGGNSLTSGQKAVLIYGSLFLFFGLFLSGYFLP